MAAARSLGEFKVQVLDGLLRVVSVLGAGAVVWMLVASPVPLRRSIFIVVPFLPIHVFAWAPGLPPRVRSVGLVGTLLATSLAIAVVTGPSFGAALASATVCVLAGLLHGRRAGLSLYALFALVFIFGGVALQAGYLPRPSPADPTQLSGWLTAGVSFLVIAGMLLTSVLFVVERIEMALREERATLHRFERERRERVRAEEALEAAEEALRRAQMVEAAGKLAGGVAHDFNNSLMVIHGWVDLLQAGMLDAQETNAALESISRATTSCSQLTTRLLTLGRKDVRKPALLSPREVLEDERRSLRAIMPENIDISVEVDWPGPIYADPSQLQQLFLNLALNARDAMPNGGRLSIRVLPAEIEEAEGRGTVIEVRDTGVGMQPEVQERLFEPFFTTKGAAGTGLGLAMVQSVMRQSDGTVSVETAPNLGTTVRLFFPPADRRGQRVISEGPPSCSPRINVLVVEDEAEVRAVIVRTLRVAGHHVIEAEDVASGLRAIEEFDGLLGLLVTDGIMPGRPVAELVQGFRRAQPLGKVLVCSGYLQDENMKQVVEGGGAAFLSKPVRARQLARAVSELLHGVDAQGTPPATAEAG